MRRELNHAENPWQARFAWLAILTVTTFMSLGGLYIYTSKVRTYSLPVGGVQLIVPYNRYLLGETISFTVQNNYNSPIYVENSCPNEPLSVYRYEDSKWQRTHATTLIKNCATQDRNIMVLAHSSMTANFGSWPSLFDEPGKYRIAMAVQYYNAIPYQDFEIVKAPEKAVANVLPLISKPSQSSSKKSTTTGTYTAPLTSAPSSAPSGTSSSGTGTSTGSGGSGTTNTNPVTYTLSVDRFGNYSPTSLNLKAGDYIKIVYSGTVTDEVRTRFSPISPTTSSIPSITVDSGHRSVTQKISVTGSWRYKADDHNGNSGTLTVN